MSLYDELGDEVRNKTRNLMQNIQQLRQLIDTFIKNSKTENQATHKFVSDVVNDNPLTNFTFTGKDTDLSYFCNLKECLYLLYAILLIRILRTLLQTHLLKLLKTI